MIFDRSWYNRAGVERVMGFCTDEEYARFMQQTPIFEQMLIDDGILLRKYWFSVSDAEQLRRFRSRMKDPVRQWKLSPMDLESINRWEDYSRAKDEMMAHTDTPASPWFVVESDIKKHARLNMMAHLLSTIPYGDVPHAEGGPAEAADRQRGLRAAAARALHLRSRSRRRVDQASSFLTEHRDGHGPEVHRPPTCWAPGCHLRQRLRRRRGRAFATRSRERYVHHRRFRSVVHPATTHLKLLPMYGQTCGNRSPVTCHLKCDSACAHEVPNPSTRADLPRHRHAAS